MNTDDLKQQVESAIALFTLVDERNVTFCEGLLASLKDVEQKHLERSAEMHKVEAEVERLTQENDQLRALLKSLLGVVGSSRNRKLDEIRTRLERRMNRLTQSADKPDTPDSQTQTAEFPVPDTSIDEIVARIGGRAASAEPAPEPTEVSTDDTGASTGTTAEAG